MTKKRKRKARPPVHAFCDLLAALTRFTTDGRLDMTNNAGERATRPIAIGRNNWIFEGSDN